MELWAWHKRFTRQISNRNSELSEKQDLDWLNKERHRMTCTSRESNLLLDSIPVDTSKLVGGKPLAPPQFLFQ